MRLRNTLRSLLALLLVLFLTTLATAKVITDYDHTANFSSYHTYAWTEGTRLKDDLMDQRIRDNVDHQLTAKGLQKVTDPGQADLLVSYDAAVGQQAPLNTAGIGRWGYGWGDMGITTTSTSVSYIPVGSVIVKLGDNKTHKIIWRGNAPGTITNRPEKIAEQIQKNVARMFSRYPPKG